MNPGVRRNAQSKDFFPYWFLYKFLKQLDICPEGISVDLLLIWEGRRLCFLKEASHP